MHPEKTQWVFDECGYVCLSQTILQRHIRNYMQGHQVEFECCHQQENLIYILCHKQFKNVYDLIKYLEDT